MPQLTLRTDSFTFVDSENDQILESVKTILRISDDEMLGFQGYMNLRSLLFKNEVKFTEGLEPLIKQNIERYEIRVTVDSMVLTQINPNSYNMRINMTSYKGSKLTLNMIIPGF